MKRKRATLAAALVMAATATAATAAAQTYELDPEHTFPSFEADHMGISVWRGKFNKTTGTMVLDRAAQTGQVEAVIDIASVDFGHDKMNEHALSPDFFNVEKYPTATYKGTLAAFKDGVPTQVVGELTLHGVTQPLTLDVKLFKCIPHPLYKRELCGADAYAVFQRDAYGLTAGKYYGFNMDVALRIQMEALIVEDGGKKKKKQ
ncbi:MAG TPA: YceI family protein [Solimonas sp.]